MNNIYFIRLLILFLILCESTQAHLRDTEIEEVIYEIARPLIEYAGLSSEKLKIYIENDYNINAFATSDMTIHINTGLLIDKTDPSILLGVLAHEIGHLKYSHLSQRMSNKEGLGEAVGIMLLGGLASMASNSPDMLVGSASLASQYYERFSLKFNRGQESQADNFALASIKHFNYPYEGFLNFFKSSRYNKSNIDVKAYSSTHPSDADRIANIEEYIKNNKLPANLHLSSDIEKKFRRAFIKLKAYLTEEEKDLKLITDNMSEEEKKYTYAIFWYKKNSPEKALNFAKSLISLRENDYFYRELFSQILYAKGDIKEAINEMTKLCNIMPENVLSNIELANYEIQFSVNKKNSLLEKEILLNQAIARLKFIITKEEDNIMIYRLLARAYGNKGQEALSNFYLAKEAFIMNDYQKTSFFAEKAKNSLKKESSEFWEAESLFKEAELKKRII